MISIARVMRDISRIAIEFRTFRKGHMAHLKFDTDYILKEIALGTQLNAYSSRGTRFC